MLLQSVAAQFALVAPWTAVDSIRGATGAPLGCNSLTTLVQLIRHPERIRLGTTGSPAGFLTTKPTPATEPENTTSTLSPRFTSATPWQTRTAVKSGSEMSCSVLELSTSLPLIRIHI